MLAAASIQNLGVWVCVGVGVGVGVWVCVCVCLWSQGGGLFQRGKEKAASVCVFTDKVCGFPWQINHSLVSNPNQNRKYLHPARRGFMTTCAREVCVHVWVCGCSSACACLSSTSPVGVL